MINTKQQIQSVALNLFSQRGFSSVSIRDICKQVGIKESTVYYHFKNKQAIFDTLQNKFVETVEGLTSSLTSKINSVDGVQLDNDLFEKIGSVYIEDFLLNDFCNAFIRTLNIERFSSESARHLYNQWMIDYTLHFQAGIFSYLMKCGIIPPIDCNYLAVQYYAPVFLYYERYLLSGELTEEKKNLFRQYTNKHFSEFMKD